MVDGSMRCLGPSSHLKARFANGMIWLITSTLSSFSELEITIIVSPSTTASIVGLNVVSYPIRLMISSHHDASFLFSYSLYFPSGYQVEVRFRSEDRFDEVMLMLKGICEVS